MRLVREARALVTGPSGRKQPVTRPRPPARAEDLRVRDYAESLEQSHPLRGPDARAQKQQSAVVGDGLPDRAVVVARVILEHVLHGPQERLQARPRVLEKVEEEVVVMEAITILLEETSVAILVVTLEEVVAADLTKCSVD